MNLFSVEIIVFIFRLIFIMNVILRYMYFNFNYEVKGTYLETISKYSTFYLLSKFRFLLTR